MSQPVPHRSHVVLVIGSVGYACYLFAWFAVAAFLTPISTGLGLSNAAAGLLTGAIPLMYVPFALPVGLVVDRMGARRAIGAGLVVVGLAHAARSVVTTFPAMLGLTLLIGVSGTTLTFGLPKLVSDLFPSERSGMMSSVYLVGLYAGTAVVFGLGPAVLGPAVGGWRPLFAWSGLVTAGVAVIWLLAGRGMSKVLVSDGGRPSDQQTFHLASFREDVRQVVTHRSLLLLVVVGTMYLFALHGLQGWLVVVLEGRGIDSAVAGTITSGLIVAQLLGTLVLPPLSDYLGRRRAMIVACGGLVTLGTVALLVFGALKVVTATLVVGAAGIGLGGLATFVRSLPLELEDIGSQLAGTAVGLIFSVGELGGFAGPFVIGVLRDQTGSFDAGLLLVTSAGVVVVLAALPLRSIDSV